MKYTLITCLILLVVSCSAVREIFVSRKNKSNKTVTSKIKLGPVLRKDGILFCVKAPVGTYSLTVTGSFNQWNPESFSLTNNKSLGVWQGFIPYIKKGRIEFKYIRNGSQWLTDPFTKYVADGYGSKNSLIIRK